MPQGNSAATRDARHILHGYCNLADQRKHGPSVISGGQGIYVFDENGNAFLEAAAGMWCAAFGFNDEELIEAAIEQLYKLPYYHTLAYKSVNPAIDLAEKLSKIIKERSQGSQFIMVSLKDSVVEKAKLIYGVFPKNGVSNVIKYKDKHMLNFQEESSITN